MDISFAGPDLPSSGSVVVGVFEERQLSPRAAELDQASSGALSRAMSASRFVGKKDELLPVLAPAGCPFHRILLAGLGRADGVDAARLQALGGHLYAHLNGAGESLAKVLLDAPLDGAAEAAEIAYGAQLRAYRFHKYRTKLKPEQKPTLEALVIAASDPAGAGQAFQSLASVAAGVHLTRDLCSEPPNILYPESLAAAAQALSAEGIDVEVLDEVAMGELGMGALLGVAQGSARPPRLVVMRWNGGGDEEKPIAFLGKGVTFDTGGISIKPAGGMEDMKWDMAGAGVVIGLMKALAGRSARVNAIGIIGLVENMLGPNAQRPGDIVTSLSGQTIEVLNTDAEGRLVLADALWYCQDRFKPELMIDLATLTGAIIVALGHEYGGLFSNDEALAEKLLAAGKAVGEPLWRMPLGESYDRDIDSDAADVKNIGSGRGAGSVIAAQFLQRFVTGVPWAHLDIAGMAWSKKDTATVPKGATAYGVRLLDRFVRDREAAGAAAAVAGGGEAAAPGEDAPTA